jgi:ribulose-phosphate 3-epimerase
MKIVPAILAEDSRTFLSRLRQVESFAGYVQIDLMDGVFVPTRSFSPEEINTLNTSLSLELHLMVKDPAGLMSRIKNPRLKKVVFHFESDVRHLDFINQMKKRGLDVGLAINPDTKIKEFKKLVDYVDTLLFLTVDPCCYGNPFRAEVLKKIAEARRLFPDAIIAVDGGVSLENLKSFVELGVDYVCVGSKIFLDGTPEKSYRVFLKKLGELEAIYES